MFRWISTGRIPALVAAMLLVSFAIGMVDPLFVDQQPDVAANLVEELEVDAEEFRCDIFLTALVYEVDQMWRLVSFWPLRLSDRPRHGLEDIFLAPQLQRPPPVLIDLCI
jgi:hypothetical protein